jgi:hypothetical protein
VLTAVDLGDPECGRQLRVRPAVEIVEQDDFTLEQRKGREALDESRPQHRVARGDDVAELAALLARLA